MWVYYYLGIGIIALVGIFLWRKDMRSMVGNALRDMGMFGLYYWGATTLVFLVLWFMWVMVVFLAIRRQLLHRPNVAEE